MKILISVLVFMTTLTIGLQTLAAETERDMSALFPQPKANLSLGERPDKPTLQEPVFEQHISGDNVTLKWADAKGAEVYHVQVATDPNFKWLVKEENLYKGTSLAVNGLQPNKHYFWRVAGLKPENKNGHIKGPFNNSMFTTETK